MERQEVRQADFISADPLELLLFDELLLERCDENGGPPTLRLWEPDSEFVVLGYGNVLASEVHLDACRAAGVPVFRRCSGGGTVLQGPGCMNFSLVLPFSYDAALESVAGANEFIMERHRRALQSVTGQTVTISGCTDLAVAGAKVSGNSQRRRRSALLFHGTFLMDFPRERMERFLQAPPREPAYRAGRTHLSFTTNLGIERERLCGELKRVWNVTGGVESIAPHEVRELADARRQDSRWHCL